jgi:hypothetical protein
MLLTNIKATGATAQPWRRKLPGSAAQRTTVPIVEQVY